MVDGPLRMTHGLAAWGRYVSMLLDEKVHRAIKAELELVTRNSRTRLSGLSTVLLPKAMVHGTLTLTAS